MEKKLEDAGKEIRELLISQEARLQLLESQLASLKEGIGNISRQIEDQKLENRKLLKDMSECQERDLNLIFKYLSKGLELHPYKGYLHRILAADYRTAKINHYVRYKYAAGCIKDGDFVLDAACGVGFGSSLMVNESNARFVYGVDLSEEAVEFAERIFKHDKIRFKHGNCLDPSLFDPLQFELIVSFETIEHVEDDGALMQNFHKWLKKGGSLIGSVPNQDVMPFHKDEHLYHYRHYTRDMLSKLLHNAQFEINFLSYGGWETVPVEKPDYTHIFIARKSC